MQDESILADLNYKLNTRATELLFLKWFIDHLTPNGRAGVIVPSGVLFGSTNAAKSLRELLLTECDLQAVVNLPSGVFKPYAGVSTAALIFEKGKPTQSVWFYDITADGFSLDDKRTPIEANDIPDVLAKWPNRDEGPNSYRVPIEKIRENEWSLAVGRYKPVTTEAVNHDPPVRILGDVLKLEDEIIRRGNTLLTQITGQEMKRWSTKPLGELLIALESGLRPKGGVVEISDGIPSVSGEHINRDGEFIWEAPKHVTREFYSAMRRGRIQRGDILVVKDGATTGKTAMVRDDFPFREAAINEHVFLLRTDKARVLPEFAGYFLFSPLGSGKFFRIFAVRQLAASQRILFGMYISSRAIGRTATDCEVAGRNRRIAEVALRSRPPRRCPRSRPFP